MHRNFEIKRPAIGKFVPVAGFFVCFLPAFAFFGQKNIDKYVILCYNIS